MDNKIMVIDTLKLDLESRFRHSLRLIFGLIFCLLFYPAIVYMFFSANWDNSLLVITMIFYVLVGWLIIYQLLTVLVPSRKILLFCERALQSEPLLVHGTITKMSTEVYTMNGIDSLQLELLKGDNQKVLYIPSNHPMIQEYLNHPLRIQIYDSFIVSYERVKL